MNQNSISAVTKILALVCGLLITSNSLAGVILADSYADWGIAANNGMDVDVLLGCFVLGQAQLALNLETYNFIFENVAVVGSRASIRFAAGPKGPIAGANTINDFFNEAWTS